MLPVDPRHERNHRDDGYADFDRLKATGQVRNKQGRVISIHDPSNTFSALQRDELYQAYCQFKKVMERTPADESAWIDSIAAELQMSSARARDIINEGNGQYAGENMQWWRGLSVP